MSGAMSGTRLRGALAALCLTTLTAGGAPAARAADGTHDHAAGQSDAQTPGAHASGAHADATAGPHAAHDPASGHDAHDGGAERQLYTCGMHPQVIRDRPGSCPICGMELTPLDRTVSSEPDAASGAITIDPAIVQNMGVRTAEVAVGPLVRRVRATGVLAEAQPLQHDVSLRVSGWIEKLHADVEGMRVKTGDPLFDLYSPELQVAIGELIAARRARDAHAVGAPLAATAVQKLELLGLSRTEIERLGRLDAPPATVTFRSPIDGAVIEKPIVAGDAVEAGMRALRIVDHRELWLDARVFEQDLPALRVGLPARATLASEPGRTVDGTISFVHPHVDPVTRTTVARMTVPNPDRTLRPGMWATVEIDRELDPSALLVPRDAVIDTGTEQIAFLALDGGRFEPRRVTLGPTGTDGRVQVTDGLAAGDVVVTSGQFLLDAESNLREALQRFLGAPGHVH